MMGAVRVAHAEGINEGLLKSLGSGDLYILRLQDGRLMDVWFDEFDPPRSGMLWVLFTAGNSPLG